MGTKLGNGSGILAMRKGECAELEDCEGGRVEGFSNGGESEFCVFFDF
jgi:hypothetical protein